MPKDVLIDFVPDAQTRASESVAWDAEVPHLGVRQRGAARSWTVQWRQDGRSRKRTLGQVAKIDRDTARRLARDLLLDTAEQADGTQTITAFGARYLADQASSLKPTTQRGHASDIARLILPHLGRKQIGSRTREEVQGWMTALPYSPASRNRALAVLSGMMRHAELLRLRPPGSNPCKGLRRRRSGFTATYLTDAQWAKLGQALRKAGEEYPSAVGCLRFLALTGCRKGEALGLRWEIIDGARCLLPETKPPTGLRRWDFRCASQGTEVRCPP
ncbi:MAG: site-specific integrase [Pseudomonadota bacterium]